MGADIYLFGWNPPHWTSFLPGRRLLTESYSIAISAKEKRIRTGQISQISKQHAGSSVWWITEATVYNQYILEDWFFQMHPFKGRAFIRKLVNKVQCTEVDFVQFEQHTAWDRRKYDHHRFSGHRIELWFDPSGSQSTKWGHLSEYKIYY